MSNYFHTLKRLEEDHAQATADAFPPRTRVEPGALLEDPAVIPPASAARKVVPTVDARKNRAPRIIEQQTVVDERLVAAFSALYDNLCTIRNGSPVGTFVIAGASAGEAVERVTTGLAAEIGFFDEMRNTDNKRIGIGGGRGRGLGGQNHRDDDELYES